MENAPEQIIRGGLTYHFRGLALTYQLSYVGASFSNANNLTAPSIDGNNGLIPSYTVSDLSLNYKFLNQFNIKAGVNNLFDAGYFTRRSGAYPGPGLLPSDGRSIYLSIGARL